MVTCIQSPIRLTCNSTTTSVHALDYVWYDRQLLLKDLFEIPHWQCPRRRYRKSQKSCARSRLAPAETSAADHDQQFIFYCHHALLSGDALCLGHCAQSRYTLRQVDTRLIQLQSSRGRPGLYDLFFRTTKTWIRPKLVLLQGNYTTCSVSPPCHCPEIPKRRPR